MSAAPAQCPDTFLTTHRHIYTRHARETHTATGQLSLLLSVRQEIRGEGLVWLNYLKRVENFTRK